MAPEHNTADHVAVPSAVAAASCVEAASSGIHATLGIEHRTFHPVNMDQHAQLRRTADNLQTPEASSSTISDGRTFVAVRQHTQQLTPLLSKTACQHTGTCSAYPCCKLPQSYTRQAMLPPLTRAQAASQFLFPVLPQRNCLPVH